MSRRLSRESEVVCWVVVVTLGVLVVDVSPAAATPPVEQHCGVDLTAPEIALAVKSLRLAFRDRDVAWNGVPYEGNFDRCVALSTALVTIDRATGSSPSQALFFNYGEFLGTATWSAYPFTSLNVAQTTDRTIVLDYKDGRGVCTACAGPIYTVRYQWTGNHVEMLDPPPPQP
jgi:hypothetical protein